MRFSDRRVAGRTLADALRSESGPDVVVLGLPRGGVPVAAEVACGIDAPLDVVCVRKLGHPAQPELGVGAIAEEGVRVLDRDLMARTGVRERELEPIEARETAELARRAARYRQGRPPVPLAGRTAVIVDDGLATGVTARAAVLAARRRGAARVIVAVPVASPEAVALLEESADAVVTLSQPVDFMAVGAWYQDFRPTTDEEVLDALATPPPRSPSHAARTSVPIPADDVVLDGILDVPEPVRGVVIFAHGSGSSRHSLRNQAVAGALNRRGFATLLFDLLTEAESGDRDRVFDIPLLARRLDHALTWVGTRPELRGAAIGLFGASTGAAAALRIAATTGAPIGAVVSRGGRPDLAEDALDRLRVPVLLIVGGADAPTLEVNRRAATRLRCPNRLEVIPGATHLFEEPGALDRVAALATAWFEHHLATPVANVATGPDRDR